MAFWARALMENRHGMLADFQMSLTTGTAERGIMPDLLYQAREKGSHPKTLGEVWPQL